MTFEQAKALTNQILYCNYHTNCKGEPSKVRVNGKVKLWKRNPNRIQVPLKYGLRDCFYLTEDNLNNFFLTMEEAIKNKQ